MKDGAYEHRFHVGNVGDVLKHIALLATLRAHTPRRVIDTHAGAGRYKLDARGEWQQGAARIVDVENPPGAVADYIEALSSIGSSSVSK